MLTGKREHGTAGELERAGIPYVPAVGAMSVWFDLRAGLVAPTWEAERALWNALVDKHRVVLTPGARVPSQGFQGEKSRVWIS